MPKLISARHAASELSLAVTNITIDEVLIGPLGSGDETLATRYPAQLKSWRVVELTADIADIAETAAGLLAKLNLRFQDAIQVASVASVNTDVRVAHDRGFAKVKRRSVVE